MVKRVSRFSERIVLKRRGKKLAAVVPIEDFVFLEQIDKLEDEKSIQAIRKARKEKGGITLEEFCRKNGIKL